MFYEVDGICYCTPDSIEGDFAVVGQNEFVIECTSNGVDYITANSGQTYILVS